MAVHNSYCNDLHALKYILQSSLTVQSVHGVQVYSGVHYEDKAEYQRTNQLTPDQTSPRKMGSSTELCVRVQITGYSCL